MSLSIWHFDAKTGKLTFEQDFREKGNKYFTNVDGMLMDESVYDPWIRVILIE